MGKLRQNVQVPSTTGEGKGLKILVDCRLTGNFKYLEKFSSRLKRRESTCDINSSDVKKSQVLTLGTVPAPDLKDKANILDI